MNAINENELFENLRGFLKAKGIELTDGSYAHTVQRGCSLLTDAINLSQQGLDRAGTEFNKRLDQLRQCVHEKTAPKPAPEAAPAKPAAAETAPGPPPATKQAAAKAKAKPAGKAARRPTRRKKTAQRGPRR